MHAYVLRPEGRAEKDISKRYYKDRGDGGTLEWPIDAGEGLGTVGAWNVLFRLGLHPRWLDPEHAHGVRKGDTVFAVADSHLTTAYRSAIGTLIGHGATVVVSGSMRAWAEYLPKEACPETVASDYPYAALAWVAAGRKPQVIAPPGWPYARIAKSENFKTIGLLVAIRGERQSPERALVTPLPNAPALVQYGQLFFLNGSPFAAFQAWLQGQESLNPWLQWRHRLFWLDEFVSDLAGVFRDHGILAEPDFADTPGALPSTTVILRHDLDHSRDTSYMELERREGVPAVHAVLKDENTAFWLKVLRNAPNHEVAFHYNTGQYGRWREAIRKRLGLRARSYRPDRKSVVGNGLLRQVRWAKRRGIGVATLHRHLGFLIYPEWIDAMHRVFEAEPEVLGASSLFRAQVLRWGNECVDGAVSTSGEFPDSQFPYWFPFKLAHAGLGGLPLRGWETTSVMEIEPELFEQMLDHQVPMLRQRVFSIIYHPAHAHRPTFSPNGSLAWWREILRIIRERGIKVMTPRDLFMRLNAQIEKENSFE